MTTLFRGLLASALIVVIDWSPVCAQSQGAPYAPPNDIAHRRATIVSEGIRLTADLFTLKDNEAKALPTIIMSHGWGGFAEALRADAIAFVRAGYFVVLFDYRGWGASEGRVVLTKPLVRGKPGEPITAEVKEVREVVDPLDQTTDLQNVVHWVHGEKQCDAKRIGLWGSSYSGGHVVYVAAKDPRVKATVSQVPGMDSRFVLFGLGRKQTFDEATKRAHGEIGYPEAGVKSVGNLRGAPIRERLMHYAPVDEADKAPQCAMLFIIAEKEELFNNRDHGVKAHERAKGPKKLVTIPNITHYGIYKEGRAEAQRLAIEWYDEHLKGERPDRGAAFEANKRLGRGINLGNALEAPKEGAWGVTLKADYFRAIKAAGFATVRLPVRWSAHAQAAAPHKIDAAFMSRVHWAIDQALASGLNIIVNTHHYDEIYARPDEHGPRLEAIWTQVAESCKDRPATVFFELLNEPNGKLSDEKWNAMIPRLLAIVRKSNPTRPVIVGPGQWNAIRGLDKLQLPAADRNLIVTVHFYDPFEFTHQDTSWVKGSAKWKGRTWSGSDAEQAALAKSLDKAAAWAKEHDRPVFLGEFGAYQAGDLDSRARWTRFVAREAERRGFSWAYWEFCSGFGAYDPKTDTWRPRLKAALVE